MGAAPLPRPSGGRTPTGRPLAPAPAPPPPPRPASPAPPSPGAWDGHDLHHSGQPRVTWSGRELAHLAVAVAAITLCFAFFRSNQPDAGARAVAALTDGWNLLACFVAVSTGFVLHELAHKIAAQRYGHWAEFRADAFSLVGGLLMSLFAGFFVAAPGAVWIQGRPPPRQYGLISLVGPAVNLAVALLAFAAFRVFLATSPGFGIDREAPLELVLGLVAVINAVLAVFNLLPISLPFLAALDGRKVWWWSKRAWLASFAFAVALMVWVYLDVGAPILPLG